MASTRRYCPGCHYPARVCICDAVHTFKARQKIIILQHPVEAKHAKNTTRLITLCMPDVTVLCGEHPHSFSELIKKCSANPDHFALIYPSSSSKALENHSQQFALPKQKTLIFIDATWRKAFKIWQLNPWLSTLPQWHFAAPPASKYTIRKTSVDNGLSTLEALAYTLNITEKLDCHPLLQSFLAMQDKVFSLAVTDPD
ncbi:MAG: DTW domain-containing protein YfiP [Paraglaciecola sp.]|jgi:DTW domain-containing protein YfiP